MEKVTAGSPLRIPAATFNSFIDAAQAVKDMQSKTSVQKKNTNSGLIVIENNSGGDLEAYDILGIDDPITTPTTDENRFCEYVAFGGSTPDETKHIAKWALLLEPVASGEVGRAAVNGVFPVKINVIDENHTHVEMSDGSSTLDSTFFGSAKILWKESGTGDKWATIVFPVSGEVFLWQATADASSGEITGKMLDEDLDQTGDTITFITES